MEEFLRDWGYLGIFLGIIATGVGFPMPEELPVVVGGVLAGTRNAAGDYNVYWWLMLPVCIVGVIIGDSLLYFIGRLWGRRLVEVDFIKKHLLPPERMESIRGNFHDYGIKILLFARLTPGIRAPIFLMAGITHLPLLKFIVADSIYAIPGVSLLFGLGWYFTDTMVAFIKGEVEMLKTAIMVVAAVGVIGYFLYRYLRKPVLTGDPHEMPPGVEQVTHTLEEMTSKVGHKVADMTSKIMHPKGGGTRDEGPGARDSQRPG
jgi:membrane protein DedA with SNARE-associated domain